MRYIFLKECHVSVRVCACNEKRKGPGFDSWGMLCLFVLSYFLLALCSLTKQLTQNIKADGITDAVSHVKTNSPYRHEENKAPECRCPIQTIFFHFCLIQYTRQFTLTAVLIIKVTNKRGDVSQYAWSHIVTCSVGDGRCLQQGMKMCFTVKCLTRPITYHSLVMSTPISFRHFLQNACKLL